jgi:hypothetical protein
MPRTSTRSACTQTLVLAGVHAAISTARAADAVHALELALVVDEAAEEWRSPVTSARMPAPRYSLQISCTGPGTQCTGYAVVARPNGAMEPTELHVERLSNGSLQISSPHLFGLECPDGSKAPLGTQGHTLVLELFPGRAVVQGCGDPVQMSVWEGPRAWLKRANSDAVRLFSSQIGFELAGCRPFAYGCTSNFGMSCRGSNDAWLMFWRDGDGFRAKASGVHAYPPLNMCADFGIFVGGWVSEDANGAPEKPDVEERPEDDISSPSFWDSVKLRSPPPEP